LRVLEVDLGHGGYRIIIDTGGLGKLGAHLVRENLSERSMVVTDRRVGRVYGELVSHRLAESGIESFIRTVPVGERSKSFKWLSWLYDQALAEVLDRRGQVIALGGGVVGDLAGFMAATYLRGVRLIQVPTTLLAQVDSSIGGKTGINLRQGKNLVGSFYQPSLVFIDPVVLKSLALRHYRAGWAEIAKYAFIGDLELVSKLENNIAAIKKRDVAFLEDVIADSCDHKRRIVEADEKEAGVRSYLNYGHTIGHAVEMASGYKLLHGEAVSVGIVAVAYLAEKLGLRPQAERQEALLRRLGLPVRCPGLDLEAILGYLRYDKKSRKGVPRFILTPELGKVEIYTAVPEKLIREVLRLVTREE